MVIRESAEDYLETILVLKNRLGTAAEDACKIEHVISSESFSALKKYLADNEKN